MNDVNAPLIESPRTPDAAYLDQTVLAGNGWSHVIPLGNALRIVDRDGNQAVDTLFYDAHDHANRYSADATIREQGALYLTTGSALLALDGIVLMTITADTCGRHDTIGGACSAESNQVRYAIDKRWMHSCRDTFLNQLSLHRTGCCAGMSKRDLTANVNFFMNVPVTTEGALSFADGISAPGRYVELTAVRDTLAVISNCPQLNNPCNGWNPTPIQLLLWSQ